MELRHLRTFLAIVDSGTLTGAGRALYKTQGAISQDLKALEAELGAQLLDRTGQRVKLTPAGTALFPLATQVVLGVRKIDIEISRVKRGEGEVVRFGTLPSLALNVGRFLLLYREDNPGLRFVLFTELQSILMEWLTKGSLDVVLGYRYIADGLRSTELGTEDVFLLVHRDSPLAVRPELTAEDVKDQVFIGLIREMDSAPVAERFFAPLGKYPEPVLEVGDVHVIVQLVSDGHGFAVVPASAVATATLTSSNPEVVAVPLRPRLRRPLAVFARADAELRGSMATLYEEIVRNWRPEAGWSADT